MSEEYRTILADPPWLYANWRTAAQGAQSSQYAGMPIADMLAMGEHLREWSASSSVLFLWSTWPFLAEAMQLIDAWGFTFKTGLPWVKTVPSNGTIRRGTGFWIMGASEPLLIATRGKVKIDRGNPAIGLLVEEPRVFYAPIGRHSEKREEVQDWIERLLPGMDPRLELFARRERPGWDCWGLDTGWRLDPQQGVTRQPTKTDEDVSPGPLFEDRKTTP